MQTRFRVEALVPAAGAGLRIGLDRPKQFLIVAGRPVLSWTLHRLLACGVARCTVAVPVALLGEAGETILEDPRVQWVAGGETRQDSVAACLAAASGPADDLILVHDGARPAVAEEDVRATIEAAARHDGAVLGRFVGDTLKRLEDGRIVETIGRSGLFHAETPQVFRRGLFERALEESRRDGFQGTDEASLVERLAGAHIRSVLARSPNPKLTHAADLELIEALLSRVGGFH